jgi:hypothetical protein
MPRSHISAAPICSRRLSSLLTYMSFWPPSSSATRMIAGAGAEGGAITGSVGRSAVFAPRRRITPNGDIYILGAAGILITASSATYWRRKLSLAPRRDFFSTANRPSSAAAS